MAQRRSYRVTPLRRAVTVLKSIRDDLQWLQWLLISHTTTNIRSRHARWLRLLEKGHAGAQDVMRLVIEANQRTRLNLDLTSLEGYLNGMLLHQTYLRLGGKTTSQPYNVSRVLTLIERARSITLGSNRIDWLLEGAGAELSRFIPENLEVELYITRVSVPGYHNKQQVIGTRIRERKA